MSKLIELTLVAEDHANNISLWVRIAAPEGVVYGPGPYGPGPRMLNKLAVKRALDYSLGALSEQPPTTATAEHPLHLTCPFDGEKWSFHTQLQANMLEAHLRLAHAHTIEKAGSE